MGSQLTEFQAYLTSSDADDEDDGICFHLIFSISRRALKTAIASLNNHTLIRVFISVFSLSMDLEVIL